MLIVMMLTRCCNCMYLFVLQLSCIATELMMWIVLIVIMSAIVCNFVYCYRFVQCTVKLVSAVSFVSVSCDVGIIDLCTYLRTCSHPRIVDQSWITKPHLYPVIVAQISPKICYIVQCLYMFDDYFTIVHKGCNEM